MRKSVLLKKGPFGSRFTEDGTYALLPCYKFDTRSHPLFWVLMDLRKGCETGRFYAFHTALNELARLCEE
jgi:hypothetical protein